MKHDILPKSSHFNHTLTLLDPDYGPTVWLKKHKNISNVINLYEGDSFLIFITLLSNFNTS